MASLGLLGAAALAAGALCLTSGCSSIGYYAQSINGHLTMLRAARPVPELLADGASDAVLKERLALSQRMRDFAVAELKLPDNASYRRFADLKRGAAVWNVVAAPELSLQLKTWCYPIMGCAGYRGYFERDAADSYAAALREEHYEVSVYGVPAYSTLGRLPGDWMADPLLNTFIHWPEGELARLIFHEISHQVAYAADDTEFNESFATAVERIGGARWLASHASDKAREEYAVFDGRRQDFRAFTMGWRERLDALYRSGASDEAKRTRKAELVAQMRSEYETMKRERWSGFSGYDGWFARANNAAFGVLAAYNALVPGFERLFERSGRDFERFYAEVKRLAALPRAERRAALASTGD
ncbi:MAG: aminopeptidase [Burkholderiales bacterium]|nr:aminopeptidase [Burkholderiales bacterium]